jgi:hypothetical protein
MSGIDIIIPVHKYTENISGMLKRCLTSIKEMAKNSKTIGIECDIHIVGPEDLPQNIMELIEWTTEFKSFNKHVNNGDLDFCSQVNFAVNNVCKNDYFMIVEFDDMVTPKWLNMASPYINEHKKCPLFLPLVEAYDINNPSVPVHYVNEIGWSSSFIENELGVLTTNLLKDYCNFNLTGSIIKRNDFIKSGCFKTSIKLSFCYELLLRFANLYNNVFVIPKVGYFHFINREDSLTSEYHKTMDQKEGSWWIKLATEEYQYKKDRKKTYTPEKE